MRLVVRYSIVCFVIVGMAIMLCGCFIQDFNKNARMANYGANASPATKPPRVLIKPQESTSQTSNHHTASYATFTPDSDIIKELLRQQEEWSSTPYVSGGVKKNGADCSGFVMSVFEESFGVNLPRVTTVQMEQGENLGGKHISYSKLKAGDLVFFKTGRGATGYHVGIYLQDGDFLHLSTKGGAKIANLSSSYWKPKLKRAVRYPLR